MQTFLSGSGFLGTSAPFHSDLSLVFILISAVLFTIGWRLAVGKHYDIHQWVQTAAAVFNTLAVATVMIPAFIAYIIPGIPAKLLEGSYGVTTVHAVIGTLGLLLGVYVVLSANGLLPARLRFHNYKPFMRTSYAIYMIATVIGVVVYVVVYLYHL